MLHDKTPYGMLLNGSVLQKKTKISINKDTIHTLF